MKKVKDIIFILVLGSVCVGLILGINSYTEPIIEANDEIVVRTTVLDAAGLVFTPSTIDRVFQESIREEVTDDGTTYYLTPKGNYIFQFQGRGLWGLISGVVTMNSDLITIENIRIISQIETPGLGARIEEKEYLAQFKNKKMDPRLVLSLRKKAIADNEIDTISGASITAIALVNMINESVADFRKKAGK